MPVSVPERIRMLSSSVLYWYLCCDFFFAMHTIPPTTAAITTAPTTVLQTINSTCKFDSFLTQVCESLAV